MTSVLANQIGPDFQAAIQFLNTLDHKRACWTFQTFDDNADRRNPALTRILNGSLEDHFDTLSNLNLQGAGIYVTVQRTDCKGRKKANITNIRTIFQEDDGDGKATPFEPHIVVESSPGKYHRYYIVTDVTFRQFEALQLGMVEHYGSDPNAKDLTRVLRLPGFYHQKICQAKGLVGTPHLVRVVA